VVTAVLALRNFSSLQTAVWEIEESEGTYDHNVPEPTLELVPGRAAAGKAATAAHVATGAEGDGGAGGANDAASSSGSSVGAGKGKSKGRGKGEEEGKGKTGAPGGAAGGAAGAGAMARAGAVNEVGAGGGAGARDVTGVGVGAIAGGVSGDNAGMFHVPQTVCPGRSSRKSLNIGAPKGPRAASIKEKLVEVTRSIAYSGQGANALRRNLTCVYLTSTCADPETPMVGRR